MCLSLKLTVNMPGRQYTLLPTTPENAGDGLGMRFGGCSLCLGGCLFLCIVKTFYTLNQHITVWYITNPT